MPFPLPAESVRALLECYLRAKDLNRPALIADCFAADAELSFSLARATTSISRRASPARRPLRTRWSAISASASSAAEPTMCAWSRR